MALLFLPLFATAQLTTSLAGKVDRSFGMNGLAYTSGTIELPGNSILGPDGMVIHAHTAKNGVRTTFLVARQLANGAPDTTFGNQGLRTIEFPGYSLATSVALQPDGAILVGGATGLLPNSYWNYACFSLTPSGQLDTTFGENGFVTMSYAPPSSKIISEDRLWSVLFQPDGKLILLSVSDQYSSGATNTSRYLMMTRLNSDGSLDKSFGVNGSTMRTAGVGIPNVMMAHRLRAKLQRDGKIIVGANFFGSHERMVIVLYRSDGTLDPEFSDDGMLEIPGYFADIDELSSGKILLLSSNVLTRLNANGSYDSSFGQAGQIQLGSNWAARSFVVDSDDKITVCGETTPTGATEPQLAARLQRFWPDGTPDIHFGQNGKTVVDRGSSDVKMNVIGIHDKFLIAAGAARAYPPFTARFFARRKP